MRSDLIERSGVTVVVPVYNGARFVERTLRSIANQTYADLHILVVDDGSTDETPAILDRLSGEMSNLCVETVENGGVAKARNIGILNSDTEFIAFCDADDLWHPTKIEKQVNALQSHGQDTSWAGCYALFRTIDVDDNVIGNGGAQEVRGAFFCSHLVTNHVGNGSSLLVRRDAAVAVGGFDPSYARQGIGGCEDRDFQLRLLTRYKLDVVCEYLVGYRTYPGNMSSNGRAMALGSIAVIEKFGNDRRLDPKVRRWGQATTWRYAADRWFLSREYGAAMRAMSKSLWLAPGFVMSDFYLRAPRLSLRVADKACRILTGGRLSLGKRKQRPSFAGFAPEDGLAENRKLPFRRMRQVLVRHDETFETRLHDTMNSAPFEMHLQQG